jgi:hypothetical protein
MENQPRSASRPSSGFAQRLKEDGRRTLEQRKRSAADRVDGIAQALERTGAQFVENDEPTLAELLHRVSGTVGNLATRLREGTLDDLVADTRSFARRNPGLFVAAGLVAGFAVARFVKASAQRSSDMGSSDMGSSDMGSSAVGSSDDRGSPDIDEPVPGAELSTDEAPTLTDEVQGESPAQPRAPSGRPTGGP